MSMRAGPRFFKLRDILPLLRSKATSALKSAFYLQHYTHQRALCKQRCAQSKRRTRNCTQAICSYI